MVDMLEVETVEATEAGFVVSVFGMEGVADSKGKSGVQAIAGVREASQRSTGLNSAGGKVGARRMEGSAMRDV